MGDIINVIPTKDIQFKTKSLLEDILSRLELSQRDRLDLQRYIEFGGGENLDNIKEKLEFVIENFDTFIKNKHNFEILLEYVDKIYALFKEAPKEFDTLKEIADWIKNNQLYKIVDELPEKGEDNKIYLINSNNPLDNNKYQEYIYINDTWEEIGGSIPLNLLDFSNNLIKFAPTKQSIITTDDFKAIVENNDLINKKGLSLPCLYKKNKSDKFGFGILAFSSNDVYQRIDIIVNNGLDKNAFSDDKSLYSSTIQLANHAYLYDTRYNILTPLGVYIFKEFVLEDYSITEKKLAKNVIENIIEKVSQDIDVPYSPFEESTGFNTAVVKNGLNVGVGDYSFVIGSNNAALGARSFASGQNTIAQANDSFASGQNTRALGIASHAEGNCTNTNNYGEHAEGEYNKSNSKQNSNEITIHSVGIGALDTNRRNAHEIMKSGKHYIYGIGGYDGTNPYDSNDLATVLSNMGGGITNITHSELVNLRNTSQLKPGMFYRITDYVTTTVQDNTQSAGHPFDIIVLAISENKLSEQAYTTIHEGDTYFTEAGANLSAWKIWYCLDNDIERFAWADEVNGKGVIYRMIDEWNNDCPYDFKNIQFARWKLSNPVGYKNYVDENTLSDNWVQESTPFDGLIKGFYGIDGSTTTFNYISTGLSYAYKVEYTISTEPTYCYTFGNSTDYSNNGGIYGNVINEYKNSNKIQLNNIVFLGDSCYSNTFGNNCYSNTFNDTCYSNTFGDTCYSNTFGYQCRSNTFGHECCYNTFGNYCYSNIFGNICYKNIFGKSCYHNTFGNYCYSNIFGNKCWYNTFGNYCYSNIFGNECKSNNFSNYCYSNTFDNYCDYNIFGNGCKSNNFDSSCKSNTFGSECKSNTFNRNCQYNTFGNYCNSNNFGISCKSNTFGSECKSNTFGESSSNLKAYYCYIIFDDGNSYINLNCTSTISSSQHYQNVRIGLGVNNTTSYKTITDTNVGQTYQTIYKPENSQELTI